MDTIHYCCPLHGTVVTRDRANRDSTEDLMICPIEGPATEPCGLALFFDLAQNNKELSTSDEPR